MPDNRTTTVAADVCRALPPSFRSRHHALAGALLLAIASLLAGRDPLLAQTNVAQLSGRITDASGGALPGATVTATSEQTGLAQTSVTDATGGYVFVSLPAGSYTLRVELTGFKPVERTNVVLDAASRRAADFQLEVGAITETISIAAITSQVETQSGDVSRVITGEQVNNIALNGRNYAQLLQLLPGAVAIQSTDPFAHRPDHHRPGDQRRAVAVDLLHGRRRRQHGQRRERRRHHAARASTRSPRSRC